MKLTKEKLKALRLVEEASDATTESLGGCGVKMDTLDWLLARKLVACTHARRTYWRLTRAGGEALATAGRAK
jgi:hypothetical protein